MRNRTLRLVVLLVIISTLLMQTVLAAANAPRTIRVGYYDLENYMIGPSEVAAKSGFTYDLLCEIAAYNDWEFEFVYGSFDELLHMLENGEIDLLPNVIYSRERSRKLLFSDISITEEHYFISAPTEAVGSRGIDRAMLNGARIATVTGAYQNIIFEEWAAENGIRMEVVYSPTFEGSWDLVRDGKADYILNIDNSAPDSGFTTIFEVGKQGAYFAAGKSRQGIMDEINSAVNQIELVSPFLISHLQEEYLSGTLSSYKLSEEEIEWLDAHDVIRVGGLSNDRPYSYIDANGNISGVYPEMLDMMIKRLGLNIRVEWTLMDSIHTLREALNAEELDLICPEYHDYYTAEQNGFYISETLLDAPMGMLYVGHRAPGGKITVAMTNSRPGMDYVRKTLPNAEILSCDSFPACVEALIEGKVNYTIAHTYALDECMHSRREELSVASLSAKCSVCFSARRSDHALIEIINRGRHLIHDTEINALEIKQVVAEQAEYGLKDFIHDNLLAFIMIIAVVALLILLLIVRSVNSNRMRRNLIEITRQKEIIEANEKELARAEEAANAASRAKTTFLFNMSHDIRTPMNAIIGFTNSARKNMGDPARLSDCLDKVEKSGRHLLSLINDVLDMARIESGKITITDAVMDVAPMFDDILSLVKEGYAGKELTFDSTTDVRHAYVVADQMNLNRILMNLVSNAVKYTPDGGRIECSITERECPGTAYSEYTFVTRDNGIGMSREFVETIFEAFTREKTSTVSGVQGTGLGMAITKQLIDRLGGKINVQSVAGEGSTFTVSLHLKLATEAEIAAYRASLRRSVSGAFDFKGRRVLLVEDNELNREIACEILEENGLEVDQAEDGDIAVEKVRISEPGYYDVVLMDIQMPLMDGYTATRMIRTLGDARAKVPIIAMTANAFEEDRRNALAAGMNDHIAKPIELAKLMAALDRVLTK